MGTSGVWVSRSAINRHFDSLHKRSVGFSPYVLQSLTTVDSDILDAAILEPAVYVDHDDWITKAVVTLSIREPSSVIREI
jgi:hypothetical protein